MRKLTLVLPILAVALLWSMPSSIPIAAIAIMVMGFSLGAEVDAIAYLVSRYFGARSFGNVTFSITDRYGMRLNI